MNPLIEKKLFELLDFAKENNLVEMTWQEKGVRIAFKRGPSLNQGKRGQRTEPLSLPVKEDSKSVCSPIVGTFRRSGSKNRPPLVVKGNRVKPGDRLGVVECMKIPTDVVSFCEGQVKEILVEDGQPVEYGQPLFSILNSDKASSNGNGKK